MTAAVATPAGAWRGHDLGSRTVSYDERDAILYALSVGAAAGDLDLVFEDRLRVLPSFALTLAQWAPDALGAAGAFDTGTAVHGAQRLRVLAPLPVSGWLTMRAHVAEVWDKESAAIFEVTVESACFVATWSLFAPGRGGFHGARGPAGPTQPKAAPEHALDVPTAPEQAALYRLLGDRHHMHIDPRAPLTSTRMPGDTLAFSQACTATASGSSSAAASSEIASGIGCARSASMVTYSAKAPSTGGVAKNRTRGHRLYRPRRHCSQRPQVCCGSTATRVPTAGDSTPGPWAATTPEASWPSTSGAPTMKSPMRPRS